MGKEMKKMQLGRERRRKKKKTPTKLQKNEKQRIDKKLATVQKGTANKGGARSTKAPPPPLLPLPNDRRCHRPGNCAPTATATAAVHPSQPSGPRSPHTAASSATTLPCAYVSRSCS